jgi:hypothetical protein
MPTSSSLAQDLAGNAASVRWLTFDAKKLTGKVTGLPAREDIAKRFTSS